MRPAISIIVPFYNLKGYVSYCLNSILAQTFRDFEAICINDGSTDGTRELLEEYAKKDSRIKLIHQENQGVSVARNYGMQIAQGKYIAFIDGDDAITPEYFEILYREAEKSGADVTFCDFARTALDLEKNLEPCKEHPTVIIQDDIIHSLLSGEIRLRSAVWAKLYHKEFIANASFDPNIIMVEDQLFTYPIIFRLRKICYIKAPMYLYTQRQYSLMQSSFSIKKTKSLLSIYDQIVKLEDKLTSPKDKRLFRKKIIVFLRGVLDNLYYFNKNDFEEILPQIQAYFQRWYTNKEIRFSDFKLRHRFLVLVLVKRWDKCLFGLYKLKSKAGDLNHAGRRN